MTMRETRASRGQDPGASLLLNSLVKSYGSEIAVDGISLDVHPGEFVTLLGPSGSGKTTTLNLIAGFLAPDQGEILMDGRSMAGRPPHRRNIGMVFQQYALFPHLTAGENVEFPLRQRKISRAERAHRVAEIMDLVALTGLERRYPRELSGGQQQRVALARAIVFQPRLLLMDEPLGALDKKLRESLQREVKRIHQELGITFIYVTHAQDEALRLSDRIAVFNRGRIEQTGAGVDLYESPASVFVADFVGESNHFTGRIEQRGEGAVCVNQTHCIAVHDIGSVTIGEEAVVVVRPEKIRVLREGQTWEHFENCVSGVVEEAAFVGTHLRIGVRLGDGKIYDAHHSGDAAWVSPGDTVWLVWRARDSIVVPSGRDGPKEPGGFGFDGG